MKSLACAALLALLSAATPVVAAPPEPLYMGTPYVYQPGNPYWFQPIYPSPSPYPFGATRPVYGRYSWDYGVYYPNGIGWYNLGQPVYPPPLQYVYPAQPATYVYLGAW